MTHVGKYMTLVVLCTAIVVPVVSAQAVTVVPSLQKEFEGCYAPYAHVKEQQEQDAAVAYLQQISNPETLKNLESFTTQLQQMTSGLEDPSHISTDRLERFGQQTAQIARDTNLQEIFTRTAEQRKKACENEKMSTIKAMPTIQTVKTCYLHAIQAANLEGEEFAAILAEGPSEADLQAFSCEVNDISAPLRTKVTIAPHQTAAFTVRTFCIDGGRSGPDHGHPYTILGQASKIGRKGLEGLLSTASQEPDKSGEFQGSIWEDEYLSTKP